MSPRPRLALRSALWIGLLAGMILIGAAAGSRVPLDRPPDDVVLADGSRLDWIDCWFDRPWFRTVHCARLYPSVQTGRPISLPVVVIRRHAWRADPQPVLYLPGGPGVGAGLDARDVGYWFAWLEEVDWPHDLVLFDPRGVGQGSPRLACHEIDRVVSEALTEIIPTTESHRRYREAALSCRDRLLRQGHDLRAYTTSATVEDVARLHAGLGIEAWNLFGVSYGSRVALELLRRAPHTVRSAILDSVYPPQVDPLLTWPALMDGALQTVIDLCAADVECQRRSPDFEQLLQGVLIGLDEAPLELATTDPYTGEDIVVMVDDDRFVQVLFDASYYWHLLPRLAPAVTGVAAGRGDALGELLDYHLLAALDPQAGHAVFLSVECHDAQPASREDYMAEVDRYPRVRAYVENDWDHDVCPDWPSGRVAGAFFDPVTSQVPTLLLAGEHDPVTPARWAEEAAATLERAHVFIRPEIGHGVIDSEVCAAHIARAFLANPGRRPVVDCE